MPARNLVVCIDGTSNKFGRRNTNVVKLYSQIKLDTEEPQQHAYYSSGIGTHAKNLPLLHRVEKVISDLFDMALAWNVEANVKDAYGWLAKNYHAEDKIYLFGFSRGAYQVRVLAGLIHEVGLIRAPTEKQIEMAFGHYRSIHPHRPETREMATQFKRTYCWRGVRIHFVGVWDTVSSVGLIKGDVFVSTSASVTNALHFRHALALDERRVTFMPEYFQEMNAHRNNWLRQLEECDIEEVWFAGCHADVGGVSRLGQPFHAGDVSLTWMQAEAAQHGLKLKPSDLAFTPENVRSGRRNSLKFGWLLLEVLFPFRHQVSFSGASVGKNKLRWHWFRPRRIVPGQRIHPSVSCGGTYRPRATLGNGIGILDGASDQTILNRPLVTEHSDGMLVAAWIRRYAAHEVGDLLQSSLENPDQSYMNRWRLIAGPDQSDFNKSVAIAAYNLVYDLGTNVGRQFGEAKQYLQRILSTDSHPDLVRALSLLLLMMKNQTLRRGIVITSELTSALIRVLERSTKDPNESTLLLVVDSICHILQAGEAECNTIAVQLTDEADGAGGTTILFRMLETNDPNQVLAALRIIVLLPAAHINVGFMRQRVKPKVQKLAKRENGLVGLMAVSAFDILREQNDLVHDLKYSNILAYLGSTLVLDVEGNTKFSLANCNNSPPLSLDHARNDSNQIISKIHSAIGSYCTSKRTAATLTFLKLCRYAAVRSRLLETKAVDNFVKQMQRKKTSLLAAYALVTLMTYVKSSAWEAEALDVERTLGRIAPSIIEMLKNGRFDDGVGLVEGFEIFRQLMLVSIGLNLDTETPDSVTLKELVEKGIYEALKKKLQIREHDGIRTSLLCIDILESIPVVPRNQESTSLVTRLVNYGLECLKNEPWASQRICIKVLSALSQTMAGEEAISSHINEIVGLLLPDGDPLTMHGNPGNMIFNHIPPSKMFGPAYALYSLSRNESLRQKIRESKGYITLKGRYLSGSLVNGPDTPLWHVRTPTKSQFLVMTAMMIKAVDEEFPYDGIGLIPEAMPVKVWNISRLRAVFTAVRGLIKFRRRTRRLPLPDLNAPAHNVIATPRGEDPQGGEDPQVPSVPNVPGPSNSGSQLPRSTSNEQERYRSQRTVTPPATPFTPQTLSVICNELHDHPPESDDDQIREESREPGPVPQPILHEGRQLTVELSIVPTEHQEPPLVNPAEEILSSTSQDTPSRLITFEEFIARDLPTKKCFGLISPRVRLKVRAGDQTFVSKTVKVGNQPAGRSKSRTHWQGDFIQQIPASDERFEVTIERKFLVGPYTSIRHMTPMSIRRMKEDYTPPHSAFPLHKRPPNGGQA